MDYLTGDKEYFPGNGKIKFEGKDSKNPLAFKFNDENLVIDGKGTAWIDDIHLLRGPLQ